MVPTCLAAGNLADDSGDAYSYRVTNTAPLAIYFAVFVFCSDGSRYCISNVSGRTQELGPGETVVGEGLQVWIPPGALNLWGGPYRDIFVLYAATQPGCFDQLIETKGAQLQTQSHKQALIGDLLPKFRPCVLTHRNPAPRAGGSNRAYQWVVRKRPLLAMRKRMALSTLPEDDWMAIRTCFVDRGYDVVLANKVPAAT
jgi:hypothetical protein